MKLHCLTVNNAPKEEIDFIRDSTIQRFEYSIDTFWKYLKVYLIDIQSLNIESASAREILKISFQSNFISDHEYKILDSAIISRNLTSHAYNEQLANQICQKIPEYYLVMRTITNKLT